MKDKALEIAKLLESFGAKKVELLEMENQNDFFKFVVICSQENEQKVQDILSKLLQEEQKIGLTKYSVEGQIKGSWIVLDLKDTIVHIMTSKERERYKLERLYKSAKKIKINK